MTRFRGLPHRRHRETPAKGSAMGDPRRRVGFQAGRRRASGSGWQGRGRCLPRSCSPAWCCVSPRPPRRGRIIAPRSSIPTSANGRGPAAERRESRPGQPVGRGDRDLSANHRAATATRSPSCQRRRAPATASGEFVLFVDLRGHCQRSAGRPPARGPGHLQDRVDSQAERWYREGSGNAIRPSPAGRRAGILSSWGDERSNCSVTWPSRTAGSTRPWRRIVSSSSTAPTTRNLVHPIPSVDLAGSRPRSSSARRRGRGRRDAGRDRGPGEAVPRSAGALAGRKGAYATIVAEPSGPTTSPRRPARRPLADLRGRPDADQGRRRGRSTWARSSGASSWIGSRPRGRLCLRPAADGDECRPVPQDRLLGYHPIVLGDQVIVCDGRRLWPTT